MKYPSMSSIFIYLFFIVFCVFCIIPLLLIISISFSNEADIIKYGFRLIPLRFSLSAYELIFKNPFQLINAYKISIFVTICGTMIGLFINSMLAYSLSRSGFKYRNLISFYLFFTMLFSGGLVPYYVLINQYLKMGDKIYVLILPYLVNVFFVFILRTSFKKIPESLIEAAKIDGATEYRIFIQIIIPLSTPVLATIGLFIALNYWNDWWLSLLFINKPRYYPIQMLLRLLMDNIDAITGDLSSQMAIDMVKQTRKTPRESIRMGMCIIAIGPIMLLFPFLQKYFVRGLTIGAVKG